MNLKIKSPLYSVAALCIAIAAPIASATPVNLAFFGATPDTVTFDGTSNNQSIVVDGIVTVTGGRVNTLGYAPPHMPTPNYTNDGGGNTPVGGNFRIDFASNVSAVGLDVYYNNADVLFQLFDSSNNLLDSIYASPTNYTGIGGFLGLNVGSSLISYAIVGVPTVSGHDLYIDNIVYQGATVPDEANIVGLLGLSFVGIAMFRRKFPSISA